MNSANRTAKALNIHLMEMLRYCFSSLTNAIDAANYLVESRVEEPE